MKGSSVTSRPLAGLLFDERGAGGGSVWVDQPGAFQGLKRAGGKQRVNSRSKGRAFEQQVARDLRASLGDGWTVTRAGTDQQRGQAKTGHAGEFAIVGPFVFPFSVECKAVQTFDEGQLWRASVPDSTAKLWAQAVRQADGVRLAPLLVVKRNMGEVLAVMRSGDAVRLFGTIPTPCLYRELGGEPVTVVRWTDAVNRGRWIEVGR